MTKYQYTYFIYPYIVDQKKYGKYLLKLIKDKNCKIKIFEKEKDLDIYNFFLPNVRNFLFPSFEYSDEKKKELLSYGNGKKYNASFNGKIKSDFSVSDEKKYNLLINEQSVQFEYTLDKEMQGKIGNENGIFFKIEGIELVCFRDGICFFIMKTHLENTNKFYDLLNFNYRFKGINSEFASLKDYENINIQTDSLSDIFDINILIKQITGINNKSNENLINSQFYTFSYVCVETCNWSEKTNFSNIENDFLRYSNVLPSSYASDFNKANIEQNLHIIEKFKYVKTSITKTSSNLMCSGIDTYNYTKLPFQYENEYFYLYILSLYKLFFLKRLNNEFKNYSRIVTMKARLIRFTKDIWNKEITMDDTGSLYYKTLMKTLELDTLFDEINTKYEIIYKDLNIEKNNKYNYYIVIMLIISLVLNTVNILYFLYFLH